jgi:hypothetical protein
MKSKLAMPFLPSVIYSPVPASTDESMILIPQLHSTSADPLISRVIAEKRNEQPATNCPGPELYDTPDYNPGHPAASIIALNKKRTTHSFIKTK